MSLTNIERVAVAAAMGKVEQIKDLKREIKPGTYAGDVAVRIHFDLEKREDTDAAPTAALLSKATLAKALVMSGVQRKNFYAALLAVATQAIAQGKSVAESLTEDDKRVILEIEELEVQVVRLLPRQPKAGAVVVIAEVNRVEALLAEKEVA